MQFGDVDVYMSKSFSMVRHGTYFDLNISSEAPHHEQPQVFSCRKTTTLDKYFLICLNLYNLLTQACLQIYTPVNRTGNSFILKNNHPILLT